MTVEDMHWWADLPLSERQKIISEYLQTADAQALDRFLNLVRAPEGFGVYASCGPNYQFAVFGRDSIAVADQLLSVKPDLTHEIILLLCSLQGVKVDVTTEEEPGRIHHEFRLPKFDDENISSAARKVLAALKPIWGGTPNGLCYYGSIDATPKFLMLVQRYIAAHGPALLDETIPGRDGEQLQIRKHVRAATDWLTGHILSSPWHLLEFKRMNPASLQHQAWKDSETSYLHSDGRHANADNGIASIEVQGLAYDALYASAELVAKDEAEARSWRELAEDLRHQTIERMWMPDEGFFALGLDRDEHGNARHIATLTSNVGALLNTNLLQDADKNYVQSIVDVLMSSEFLTAVGVRTRAVKHASLIAFADYHGSLVSWPQETFQVACGMRRHGYTEEATRLEQSILHAVSEAGEFYEFFLVQADGAVKYHYRSQNPDEPTFHAFGAANSPEPGQAWTMSAVAAIVTQLKS